ncbi:uncharacterized protein N7483_008092 [Penicillium malachiteum]|uniref:uncharacterized protein n=1 Tax=Penicillium malachiteum TaxID=1324776 RepID=UPI002547047F|nr:uncharacterized protein N7483_008092 [Penicillium malachiteum]KAJ5726735.1 hypothetical protein N7483_008092 [Penicillium malachiteum]
MFKLNELLTSFWLLPAIYAAVLAPEKILTEPQSVSHSQFTIPLSAEEGATLIANIDDPKAIDAQSACPGYKASHIKHGDKELTAKLALAGKPCNVYGNDVDALDLSIQYLGTDLLTVKITPAYISPENASWFLLPEHVIPTTKADKKGSRAQHDLDISWSNVPSFQFKVIRKSNQDVLFDTHGSKLIFEDQFIEFVTSLPKDYNLYGIGEHIQQSRLLNNLTITLWNADVPDPIDRNIYGSHPFYLDTRYFEVQGNGQQTLVSIEEADKSKDYVSYSHGVFVRNVHGQEILTRPRSLTWRALGGSVDLTFYAGPSQEEVTKSYQANTIGLPAMQQYFTFGYHQCRWGYQNWSVMQSVLSNFEKFQIPLENLWNDIDYMKGLRDFENDPVRFGYKEGEEFLERLHNGGRHYIPIVDAALYIPNPHDESDAYEPYTRGAKDDVFVKNPDNSTYIGSAWPGYTVYLDWHNEKAHEFWTNELVTWHEKIPFDGIWIDMNEVCSFCVGSCGSGNRTMNPVHPPFELPGEKGAVVYDYPEGFELTNATEAASAAAGSSSQAAAILTDSGTVTVARTSYINTTPTPGVRNINYPPYVINNVQNGHDLASKAVSPNATHIDGIKEYDVHNIYGHQVLNATYQGILGVNPKKRPFIIGRSTFAGSGQWAGHWGGDNWSRWGSMWFSIPQALSFSLFGIPMFGVDTCGFNGNTDEELCNRWMQLSAFFPFYRNHNDLSTIGQEPYHWASVIEASKTAMNIRYAILPYIYTLFYYAHRTGSTVMRALAWEFPDDPSLAGIDTQFLLGPSIMVIPVLEPRVNYVRGVFPGIKQGEIWYDWYNQTLVNAQAGVNTTISAPLGHIPVYLRGGSIIPMQKPALTIRDTRNSDWSILVALGKNGTASGQLYLDDGENILQKATKYVSFNASQSDIVMDSLGNWHETNKLANITILGVYPPRRDLLSGKTLSVKLEGENPPGTFDYDPDKHILFFTGLQKLTENGAFSVPLRFRWIWQ